MTADNDWPEFKRLVLDKLDTQHHDLKRLSEQLLAVQLQLASLKVRASAWGAAAGMLPAIAAVLYSLVR